MKGVNKMISDRRLTLQEVLSGNFSKEYLDEKERVAIVKRHIRRLSEKKFDIEDKIEVVGLNDELALELSKLTKKIEKLKAEIE